MAAERPGKKACLDSFLFTSESVGEGHPGEPPSATLSLSLSLSLSLANVRCNSALRPSYRFFRAVLQFRSSACSS